MMLSVIIPVYNEKNTILEIIKKIETNKIKKEIIIVDDCSTDGTREILQNITNHNYKILFHDKNLGKGAAIKSAKEKINGDIIVIQDADLEYNPNDYYKLIEPIFLNEVEVVYGSRVLGSNRYLMQNFSSVYRIFFNHMLTILSNFINKQNLTDAHTCYKTFSSKVFNSIDLEENDFSFCPEITTKIALKKIKIKEVKIDYNGRSYKEGKKIKLSDGIKAIKTLFKYRYLKR